MRARGASAGGGERLDRALAARGLAESRAKAQALIAAGAVRVDGARATRPALRVSAETEIVVDGAAPRHVGRGALKLEAALDAFGLDPAGAEALDLGASTGGFTEVLLERGAARVIAVDVGRGQLHPRLAGDARVVSMEGTDARTLTAGAVGAPDWITADLSFIGLAKALPAALALAAPGATLVALVKPQFEVGRARVGKGGIVRDPAARAEARRSVVRFLEGAGWVVIGETASPIAGGDGNREYLAAARKRPRG